MSEIFDADIDKVGTSILTRKDRRGVPQLNKATMRQVVKDSPERRGDTRKRAIVTSAAIVAGMMAAKTTVRPSKETANGIKELQRFASRGQRLLIDAWDDSLGGTSGLMLLTRQELGHRADRQEALDLIHTLFINNETPVINENDSVRHEEISFGDNDILAATLAVCMARSELFGNIRLFLLSEANGVYEDPNDPKTRIPVIANKARYEHLAVDIKSENGSGGMKSKFVAAAIAETALVDTWLYNPCLGNKQQALDGDIGTYFPAQRA